MKIVCPSGADFAARSVPTMPAAPARLSTTTCWPRYSESLGLIVRATMSVPPPGGKATMMRTGLEGNDCAAANGPPASSANPNVTCNDKRMTDPGGLRWTRLWLAEKRDHEACTTALRVKWHICLA